MGGDDRVYYAVGHVGRTCGWLSYSFEADRRRYADREPSARDGLDLSMCLDADEIAMIAAGSPVLDAGSLIPDGRRAKVHRGEAPWFELFVEVLEDASNGYALSRLDGLPTELDRWFRDHRDVLDEAIGLARTS